MDKRYEDMSLAQLKELAKEQGIKGISALKKNELAELIAQNASNSKQNNTEEKTTAKSVKKPAAEKTTDKVSVDEKVAEKVTATEKVAEKKSTTKKATDKVSVAEMVAEKASTSKKTVEKKPVTKKTTDKEPVAEEIVEKKPTTKRATGKVPMAEEIEEKKPVAKKTIAKETTNEKNIDKKATSEDVSDKKPVKAKATDRKPMIGKADDEAPVSEKDTEKQPEDKPVVKQKIQEAREKTAPKQEMSNRTIPERREAVPRTENGRGIQRPQPRQRILQPEGRPIPQYPRQDMSQSEGRPIPQQPRQDMSQSEGRPIPQQPRPDLSQSEGRLTQQQPRYEAQQQDIRPDSQGQFRPNQPDNQSQSRANQPDNQSQSRANQPDNQSQSRANQPDNQNQPKPYQSDNQSQSRPNQQETRGMSVEEKNQALDSGETKEGILEVMADGYGFIRCDNFLPGENDVYVSPAQIRKLNLKTGDFVVGNTKIKSQTEKFGALLYVKSINGLHPAEAARRKKFEDLTPIFPNQRLHLETPGCGPAMRMVDLVSPIGKGQRGMIVSQPKAGKTTLLKQIAKAIKQNHPEMHLIILLIDERPEEVTDMKESIQGSNVEVIYSTFDELPDNHKRVSEMVIERAKRLVEHGKDVVILLDSITRLARAYNLTVTTSGRTLSGGLDPAALHMPKRFFGAARNMREGGSLTILATALVETGSRMDDVVFEEFKGTGNMELVLDRSLSERRIFPAIDLPKSSTRREDLLLSQSEMEANYLMRRGFNSVRSDDAVERIINMFLQTKCNADFVNLIKRQKLF